MKVRPILEQSVKENNNFFLISSYRYTMHVCHEQWEQYQRHDRGQIKETGRV